MVYKRRILLFNLGFLIFWSAQVQPMEYFLNASAAACAIFAPTTKIGKAIRLVRPYAYALRIPLLLLWPWIVSKFVPVDNNLKFAFQDSKNKLSRTTLKQFIVNEPELKPVEDIAHSLSLNTENISVMSGNLELTGGISGNVIVINQAFKEVCKTPGQKTGIIGHELCHISDKYNLKRHWLNAILPAIIDCAFLGILYLRPSLRNIQSPSEYLEAMWGPREIIQLIMKQTVCRYFCRFFEKKADVVSVRLGQNAKDVSDLQFSFHVLNYPYRSRIRDFFNEHHSFLDRARYLAKIAVDEQGIAPQELMVNNKELGRARMNERYPGWDSVS